MTEIPICLLRAHARHAPWNARGLASHEDLYPPPPSEQADLPPELRKYPIPLAQKMRMVFESEVDHAGGLFVTSVILLSSGVKSRWGENC